MSLRELPAPKCDVRETLEDAVKHADTLSAVVVLGIRKDGPQFLVTSTMSQMEKTFLLAFFQAWCAKWFKLGESGDI